MSLQTFIQHRDSFYVYTEDMTKDKARQKAVAAIRIIVDAAKELAEAEEIYYGPKPNLGKKKTSRKQAIQSNKA